MTENYQYPETVDTSKPMSPELLKLWDEGMANLKRRRNFAILWMVPSALLCIWILLMFTGDYTLLWLFLTVATVGSIGLGLVPSVSYWVADDRRNAKFILRHGFSFRSMFERSIFAALKSMKEGFSGFILGSFLLLMLPFMILMVGLVSFGTFFNKLIWLFQFHELDENVKELSRSGNTGHVKGTKVLPSVKLSGSSPAAESPVEAGIKPAGETLAIFDGKIELLPNGGLVLEGGMKFDGSATFENLAIGDLILTRADAALLRVSCDGEDQAYYFNGSSWSEV